MKHETISVANYQELLDSADWCKANNDAVFTQLLKDLEKETLYLPREAQINAYFTAVKIYNLGTIRGKQHERARKRKQEIARSFEDRPELLKLFQELLQIPAEQRAPFVTALMAYFKNNSFCQK